MNGLDFDHRVRRPWANDPAFYVTVFASESDQPAREGHCARGSIELWQHTLPARRAGAARSGAALRAIPPLLGRAGEPGRGGRDLWIHGARRVSSRAQSWSGSRPLAGDGPGGDVEADIEPASAATEGFAGWLDAEAAAQDRAVRHRRRQLRLVSPARPALALHVA